VVQFLRRVIRLLPALLIVGSVSPAFSRDYDFARVNREAGGKWHAEENKMTRLSPAERLARLGLERPTAEQLAAGALEASPSVLPLATSLPASLDWRDNGGDFVTPVRDQDVCGGCWAFAAAAMLESKVLIAQGTPGQNINLSEETLIACQGPTQGGAMPNSCRGGSLYDAAVFVKQKGLPLESCYPYDATDGICSDACPGWKKTAYRIDSFVDLYPTTPAQRVDVIKQHVEAYGPTAVAMDVFSDLYGYGGGVYSRTAGSTYQGGHAVVVVGWSDAGQYFIVKNSWGPDWGEGGFFRIAYDQTLGDYTSGRVGLGWWVSAFGNAYRNGNLADLVCGDFSAPAPLATTGEPFSVEARVSNTGTADAAGSTAKLWLAKDRDGVVKDDWFAGAVPVPALAAGTDAVVSWPIAALPSLAKLPRGVRPIVVVDAGKDVVEGNEANKYAAADPLFTLEPTVWVRVTSPSRRGELWQRGQEVTVAWEHGGCTAVNLRLRRWTGTRWRSRSIAEAVPADDGSLLWTVPGNLRRSSRYKVRAACVDDGSANDQSNRFFTVE